MSSGRARAVDARLVRAVTAFAAAMAISLAVAMPAVYYLGAWQREHARSLAEATVTAAIITELATRNPELWRFEGHRMEGILGIGASASRQRVRAEDGEILAEAEFEAPNRFPSVTASAPVFDGSQAVGVVETSNSLKGAILETLAVGAIAFLLAAGAFLALRLVPLRMLAHTFDGLLDALAAAERAQADTRDALAATEAALLGRARFLAAMNHEFRTPISQVSGFSTLLLDEALAGGAGAARTDWLIDINAASRHLLELLEDATRYATLDEAGSVLHPQPVGIRQLAEAALDLAGPALEQARVSTELKLPLQGETLQVDAKLIVEALACLLRDLARRAGPGAHVLVIGEPGPAGTTITLECPSLRLSPKGLESLRSPLQAPEVQTRGLEGSGLGIAVAERIARLHGGHLAVAAAPGGGTCLSLHLPAAPPERQAAGVAAGDADGFSSPTAAAAAPAGSSARRA